MQAVSMDLRIWKFALLAEEFCIQLINGIVPKYQRNEGPVYLLIIYNHVYYGSV